MAVQDRLSEWPAQDGWSEKRPPAPDRRSDAALRGESSRSVDARREVRRRLRLIRRRRLDLLQDAMLALLLAIFVLVESAGLGVVALLAVPTALALLGSLVVERRRRRRRGPSAS